MRHQVTTRILITLVLALVAASAQAQQKSPDDLVWPATPDIPRIQYVGFVRSEKDIGRKSSMMGSLKRSLVGGREEIMGLTRPHDVHADPDGRIYVTDRAGGGRLIVFDPGEMEARTIVLTGSARLGKPLGLGGDAAGNVYVADAVNRRAVAITPAGETKQAFGGREVMLNPVDVAVTADGQRVYVVDSYLHQFLIFDAEGNLLRRVGRNDGDLTTKQDRRARHHGDGLSETSSESSDLMANRSSEPGEFRYPAFVSVGPSDTVYITDCMNFRVQVFDRDGEFIREIGQLGQTPGSLARPKGLGVDSKGHIYVADAAFNNIQIFDDDGSLLMAFGSMGSAHGEFWQPIGVSITGDRVYAVDRFNDRIQIFDYLHQEVAVDAINIDQGKGM